MRTTEEIRARIKDLEEDETADCLGFKREVLAMRLPEGWEAGHESEHLKYPLTDEFVRSEATDYLRFAFDKAIGHRGISAGRSVEKMAQYAWLLGLDDALSFAEDGDNYAYYGVPVLKKMAEVFCVEMPAAIAEWQGGNPCRPGCTDGCLPG